MAQTMQYFGLLAVQ